MEKGSGHCKGRSRATGCFAQTQKQLLLQHQAASLTPLRLLCSSHLHSWALRDADQVALTCLFSPLARWQGRAVPQSKPVEGRGGLRDCAPEKEECVPHRVVVHPEEEQRCVHCLSHTQAQLLVSKYTTGQPLQSD